MEGVRIDGRSDDSPARDLPLATVRPIEAAVGVETRAVAIRAVGGPLEAADDELALVRDAVAVGIGELPDARGVGHVEAAVQEVGALRVGELVREDGAAFEHAILVAILQEEDAVGKDGLELLRVQLRNLAQRAARAGSIKRSRRPHPQTSGWCFGRVERDCRIL